MLAEHLKNTQYIGLNDLKNEWERWTDRKYKINTAKRKVEGLMQTNHFTIEDRRERYLKPHIQICNYLPCIIHNDKQKFHFTII